MRTVAAVLLAGGLFAAAPAQALSIGPPDCHDFDRGLRAEANAAVLQIVWVGETREEHGHWITPLRAVVEEVANGRDLRRDQAIAWESRASVEVQEFWGQGRPVYLPGERRVATVDRDGDVDLWQPPGFYRSNLRTCYRRSLVSRAR